MKFTDFFDTKIAFNSPTFAKEVYFLSIWELAVQCMCFKAAISGLKNAYSYKAAGLFKAVACVRAKDVICFMGKTVTEGGSKSHTSKQDDT